MNQLIEKFPKFSLPQSYWEDMGNFIVSVTSKYGVDAKTAIPYVIIGSLCLWIFAERYLRSKGRSGYPKSFLTRSLSLGEIYGGDLALQRLVEVREEHNKARVNPATLDNTEILLTALLLQEHLDLKKLQSTVAKLEMSGREDTAIEILKKAKKDNAKKPQQAYETEMLLVEMLIYKGKFEDALRCECLEHEEIADARRPLYKAILHVMLGHLKEAEECWEEFIDIRRQFIKVKDPPSLHMGAYETITDFHQFHEKVQDLKSSIRKSAGKNSPANKMFI